VTPDSNPVGPGAPTGDVTRHAKYGNYAQWAAVGAAILLGLLNLWLIVSYHNESKTAVASDEHVKGLIQDASGSVKREIDGKFDKMNDRLTDLTGQVAHVQGQIG